MGAFELRRCMGRGGTSEVWEAWHPASGAAVAVKLLCVGDMGTEGLAAALRSEARAVASLDHPHVVVGRGGGERRGGPGRGAPARGPGGGGGLAGGWRGDRLDRPLSFDETWRTVAPLLSALAHAHARGLVHRDVKPSNVLYALREGRRVPVLADFGIAAQRSERRPRDEGFVVGTPGYMAPEQWTGAPREQGPWTDLYAMGCMIWRMLVGRAPFRRRRWRDTPRGRKGTAPPARPPPAPADPRRPAPGRGSVPRRSSSSRG